MVHMHNTLSEYAVSTLNIMKVLDKIWGFVKLKLLILRVRGMIRPHKIPRDCIEGMSLGRDNWFRLGIAYRKGWVLLTVVLRTLNSECVIYL